MTRITLLSLGKLLLLAAAVHAVAQEKPTPPKAVKVTQEDAGGTIKLKQGGELLIRLPDHGRDGNLWYVAKNDPRSLEPLNTKPAVVPDADPKKPGQTEYAEFRFKALRSGEIELHYARSDPQKDKAAAGKKEKPAKQFKVRVEVEP
jgi:predicted secreted protein